MVVVSHLFSIFIINFNRGGDTYVSPPLLYGAIYFPTAPFLNVACNTVAIKACLFADVLNNTLPCSFFDNRRFHIYEFASFPHV